MSKKMRFFWPGLLMVLGIFLSGCESDKVCDARGDSPDICEIHHRIMHTEVLDYKKMPMPSPEYLAARSHAFIHSYPFFMPEQCKRCAFYICDDCVRAEKEWKRQHQDP